MSGTIFTRWISGTGKHSSCQMLVLALFSVLTAHTSLGRMNAARKAVDATGAW